MEIIKKDGSSISLVRFFEYQGKKFLIFENGEGVDANGHITIHICNVDMTNGVVASAVQGPDMDIARNVIKTIVNENRSGMPLSIKDLNYNDLNGITILGDWPLKMMPNYIDIIKMNQPTFEIVNESIQENASLNPFNNQVFTEQPSIQNVNGVQSQNEEQQLSNFSLNQQVENTTLDNNNLFSTAQFVQPTFINEPNVLNNMPVNNTNVQDSISTPNVETNNIENDYEQKYFEQLSITNRLNAELEAYKTKFEQLKNIIEN